MLDNVRPAQLRHKCAKIEGRVSSWTPAKEVLVMFYHLRRIWKRSHIPRYSRLPTKSHRPSHQAFLSASWNMSQSDRFSRAANLRSPTQEHAVTCKAVQTRAQAKRDPRGASHDDLGERCSGVIGRSRMSKTIDITVDLIAKPTEHGA